MARNLQKPLLNVRKTVGFGLVAMVGILAGCSTSDEGAGEATTVTQASSTTSEATVTESVVETAEPETETVANLPEADTQSCEDKQLPIREQGVAAVSDGESYYHFNVNENLFDPCASISWVTLQGSLGTEDQAGATAGSSAETVVFFHYGDLVSQDPALVPRVDAVTATSDSVVAASFWVDNGPRAAGDQELRTSWYEIDSHGVLVTDDSLSDRPEIQHMDVASVS